VFSLSADGFPFENRDGSTFPEARQTRNRNLAPHFPTLRACLKMGRGSVWEGRVRLARREEGADPQRSVTDKQRRQRALPSQTLRAAGLSGLDCVGSGGTDRRRSAPPLTALPNPEFPSRRTPPHFQTGSKLTAARSRSGWVMFGGAPRDRASVRWGSSVEVGVFALCAMGWVCGDPGSCGGG